MDIIQRLIIVLLLSIPAFLPNTSYATDYDLWWTDNTTNDKSGSAESACQKEVVKQNVGYAPASPIGYSRVYQQSGWRCEMTLSYPAGSGTTWVPIYFSTITCSGTQVYNYTTHTCSAPPPPPCTKNEAQSYSTPAATGSNQCVGGCVVAMDEGRCGTNAAGVQMCFYDGHKTGDSCPTGTATGGTTTNDPAYECAKQGKTWGTVNGQTVCLKAGTGGSPPTKSVSAGKTTTNTAADGTQTTTQDPPKVTTMTPPASGAADGSPPKITEETVNPDGTASKTEESADKFCETHPDNIQCKNLEKSEYSGNCNPDGSVTISCKGDAIQCNIAQKQAEMNCKIFQPDEALTNAYNEAKNDNGSTNLSLPQNASIVNLPSELDASSPYAAQCNSDITFSFNGESITLPLSAWCGVLEAVGYLFLALSYMTAAIILGGAL